MSAPGDVVHGGLQDEELEALGLSRVDVLDLSASLNPRGPHPGVLRAAMEAELRRYPSPEAAPLRDALAARAGLEPGAVLVTPGATGAIHLAARALLSPGDVCRVFAPTFGEYAAAAHLAGARVVETALDEVLGAGPLDGTLVYLCNPNNPTGDYFSKTEVEGLLARLAPHGIPLVLDVAYDPFVVDAWDADALVREHRHVLVVHSMTKLHAVPGLRLGWVTGPASLLRRLAALQPAWSVAASAISAGLLAIQVEEQQRAAAFEGAATRGELVAALRKGGLEVRDGAANFVLVRVGDAAAFRARLIRRGFAVRDCASFGLPEWVRVAIPSPGALTRLVPAFLDVATDVATESSSGGT